MRVDTDNQPITPEDLGREISGEALVSLLVGLRAQVDALGAQVDAVLQIVGVGVACDESGQCLHSNKVDLSTMGNEEWICKDCGHHFGEEEDQDGKDSSN